MKFSKTPIHFANNSIVYLLKEIHDFSEIFEVNYENAQIFEVVFESIMSHLINF